MSDRKKEKKALLEDVETVVSETNENEVFEVIFMVPTVHHLLVTPSTFRHCESYPEAPGEWTATTLQDMLDDNPDMLDSLFQRSSDASFLSLDISGIEVERVTRIDSEMGPRD